MLKGEEWGFPGDLCRRVEGLGKNLIVENALKSFSRHSTSEV